MLGLPLSFMAPIVLAGLVALPALWWLLRVTPPRPQRIAFPPLKLMADLLPKRETPARTPWWLLALRMLIAALVILAVMLWFGIEYAWRGRFQTISGLESFSMTWAYLAIPVGAVFSALAVVGCLLDPRRQELETAQ